MAMLRNMSILFLYLALAGSAHAQVATPALRAGDWLRLQTLTGERVEGALVSLDDERLQLKIRRGRTDFPLADVKRLELSMGQDRMRGATIGAGIGLAVGVAFGAALAASGGGGSGGASFAPIGLPFVTVPLAAVLGALAAPHRFWVVTPPYRQTPPPGSEPR